MHTCMHCPGAAAAAAQHHHPWRAAGLQEVPRGQHRTHGTHASVIACVNVHMHACLAARLRRTIHGVRLASRKSPMGSSARRWGSPSSSSRPGTGTPPVGAGGHRQGGRWQGRRGRISIALRCSAVQLGSGEAAAAGLWGGCSRPSANEWRLDMGSGRHKGSGSMGRWGVVWWCHGMAAAPWGPHAHTCSPGQQQVPKGGGGLHAITCSICQANCCSSRRNAVCDAVCGQPAAAAPASASRSSKVAGGPDSAACTAAPRTQGKARQQQAARHHGCDVLG